MRNQDESKANKSWSQVWIAEGGYWPVGREMSACHPFLPACPLNHCLWLCEGSQASHPRAYNCNWVPIHLCFPNVIIQRVCRCLQLRTGHGSVVYWNIFFSPFSFGMCRPQMFPTWICTISSECFTGILNLAMCHRFNQRKCGPNS